MDFLIRRALSLSVRGESRMAWRAELGSRRIQLLAAEYIRFLRSFSEARLDAQKKAASGSELMRRST